MEGEQKPGKGMHTLNGHLTKPHIVGLKIFREENVEIYKERNLIFDWHEEEGDALHKLLANQRNHSHVEKNASQHGQGNNLFDWSNHSMVKKQDRQTLTRGVRKMEKPMRMCAKIVDNRCSLEEEGYGNHVRGECYRRTIN